MINCKQLFYKIARTDGFDFHTGKTINYRDNIGKTVKVPNKSKSKELCSSDVLHASELFFDALSYGELPCSIFIISGNPVSMGDVMCGFKQMKIIREIDITHWQHTYNSFMIWMLEDLKNNFNTKKEKDVTKTINQTIQVFVNAQKTGKIDESAARSAARSALSAARSAVDSAIWAAESADSAAWSVADSAADSAAWSARSAARSVTWSALSAAWSVTWSAESAARSAKKKELSDKFIELLESKN